jgi:16S rRNA (guanine966-N2)-methyltransferase
VIGGRSRGRRLSAPVPNGVRPTSDRVREAIFDMLGSMGGVEGLVVADLFCGSGALGIEALSRGAGAVTFVDRETPALEAVRTNLGAVGLSDAPSTVVGAVLPQWLSGAPTFDLVLCDPPYTFEEWPVLLGSMRAGLAVLESSMPLDMTPNWTVTKVRRYGSTLVTVASPTSDPAASASVRGS